MEQPDPNIMPRFNLGVGRLLGRAFGLPESGYPSEYPKHPERKEAHLEHMVGRRVMNGIIDAPEGLQELTEAHLEAYGELADGLCVQLRLNYEN